MAIGTGSLIEIGLTMAVPAGRAMNVWQYDVSSFAAIDFPTQVAEAWWNHVKSAYRALSVVGGGPQFISVSVLELNDPAGDFGEFAIPTGEQDGTRAAGTLGSYLPSSNAVGVRLAVSTRATRPGQKRIPFATEGDSANDAVGATFVGLVENLFDVMVAEMVLGAPAVGVVLQPVVTRKDVTGAVTAHQDVVGYVVNGSYTTQVSRKAGRGI